jgi:hypothetical protein
MSDNVNIIVQDTINEIVVNSAVTVETIDINVQVAVDEVNIVANPNNYLININRIIGEQVQSDWNQNDDQAPDYIKNKPSIPTLTSDLTNDGEDGVNPFITANDVTPQVNSDWNATSGVAEILNKPTIPSITNLVPYTGANQDVDLNGNDLYLNKLWLYDQVNDNHGSIHFTDSDFHIEDADGHKMLVIEDGFMQIHLSDTIQSNLFTLDLTQTRDHYLPNQSGTIALTTDIPSLTGYVQDTRTISTTTPLQGGGDLSANRTLSILQSNTTQSGFLSDTDWNTFNGKFNLPSLTSGSVLFSNGTTIAQDNANFFWDDTNKRFNIGGISSNTARVGIKAQGSLSTDIALKVRNSADTTDLISIGGTGVIGQQSNGFTGTHTIGFTGNNIVTFNNIAIGAYLIAGPGNIVSVAGQRFSSVQRGATFGNTVAASGIVTINALTPQSSGSLNTSGIELTYGINNTGTYSGIARGLFYNPTLTSLTGTTHRAIETVTGDVIFGSTSGNVLIGTTTVVASSKLTVESTTQGILFPRMTTTQRNAIASPATGLIVYDIDLLSLYQYNGSAWVAVGAGGGSTKSINSVSTNTAAGSSASTDYFYFASGTINITLPTAVGNNNNYVIKNVGTGTITIDTTSSQTIDGSLTAPIKVQNLSLTLISDGANWNII